MGAQRVFMFGDGFLQGCGLSQRIGPCLTHRRVGDKKIKSCRLSVGVRFHRSARRGVFSFFLLQVQHREVGGDQSADA